MFTVKHVRLLVAASLILSSSLAVADGTVWLPAPGTGSVSVTYVSQEADELWPGNAKDSVPLPFQGLEQDTWLFSGTYGLTDELALDANVGTSEVSPTHGRPIPRSTDGRTDLEIGMTWRFRDEIVSGGPSMAVRAGVIIAGNYEVGGRGPAESDVMGNVALVGAGPTAIGEGASGFELSGILGKQILDQLAISAEVGSRHRAEDIPRETFMNLNAYFIATQNLVFSAQYHIQRSGGDINIGPPPGPGAHGTYWEFFPQVAEDISRLSFGGTVVFDTMSVSLHWFDVLDGSNTADFSALGGTFTYNFGQ